MGNVLKCDHCEQLLADYRESLWDLRRISKLLARAGSLELDAFRRLWNDALTTRKRCEKLRTAIFVHLRSHD
jgi:hypothetical protein